MNDALYKKMAAEQKEFVAELLKCSPQDILRHYCWEYAMREDILFVLETNLFSDAQCAALLKLEKPLEEIYKMLDNCDDTTWYEHIKDMIVLKGEEE